MVKYFREKIIKLRKIVGKYNEKTLEKLRKVMGEQSMEAGKA